MLLPALPILLLGLTSTKAPPPEHRPTTAAVIGNADTGLHQINVVFLLGTDCPISRQYVPYIREFRKKWKAEGLQLTSILFCNGPQHGHGKQTRTFMQEFGLDLPWRTDPGNRYARRMGAKVVPEVLVFRSGKLVYSGAIDNMFAGLGQRRASATEHYLLDVLENCRTGQTPTLVRRPAYGCLLE